MSDDMQDVLKQIFEVEKKCADDIETAGRAREQRIADLAGKLEYKKQEEKKRITAENKKRFADEVGRTREDAAAELALARKNFELLRDNGEMRDAARERIVEILFGSNDRP